MKQALLLVALSLAPASLPAYTSLEELVTDLGQREEAALREYLVEHPDADDAAEARERLVFSLLNINDYAGALEILQQQYDGLPAEKSELELDAVFGGIVVPLIQIYRQVDRKEDALDFIEQVRDDFKDHEASGTISDSLDEFASMFGGPGIGDTFDLAFTALDGSEVDIASMTGRVVLVDFWATWCMPCIQTMPGLKSLYSEFRDRGFEIIGISLDEEREKLEEYLAREHITWPQYFDGEGWYSEMASRFGIRAIPATFLVDAGGRVVAVDASGEKLRALIADMLAPPQEAGEPSP